MTDEIGSALRRFKIHQLKAMLIANQMESKALERQYEADDLSEQKRTAIVDRWDEVTRNADATRLELEQLERQATRSGSV
jgi:hypothetical protein